MVRDVVSARGSFARCKTMPILVGAWFFGGIFLTVMQFSRQRLRATRIIVFGLAVRIQSTCRVTEPTECARELTPEIETKNMINFANVFRTSQSL